MPIVLKRFYRPELDALRFLAFAGVFSFHVQVPSNQMGLFGVSIFFILSAYLIVSILLREIEATGTINLRAFAVRRILRIWPLYFVILFSSYFLGRLRPWIHISGNAVLAFSLLAGNVYVSRYGWILTTANDLWSISVEEQFYLLISSLTRFAGRRSLYIFCCAAMGCAYISLAWLGHRHALPISVWTNSFVQFQFFAAGGLIALTVHGREFKYPLGQRTILLVAGFTLWFVAIHRFHLAGPAVYTSARLIAAYLCLLVGSILIFLAVLGIKLKIPAPIAYLGKISYGLYLFHQTWIYIFLSPRVHPFGGSVALHRLSGSTLALVATIISAMISYHYFEGPILRFKHRFEVVRTRPT